MLKEGREFPFLILAPQNPHAKQWWNIRAVMQLLDTVVSENHVDPNRLYLSGLSRGGSACWDIAVQFPDTFAAMAVVCGMTPLPYASWINREMPIWVFHGTDGPAPRSPRPCRDSAPRRQLRPDRHLGLRVLAANRLLSGNYGWTGTVTVEPCPRPAATAPAPRCGW